MADFKNILIIQTAFIGDAILASSLVEKMHTRFPEATISILVRQGNEGVYSEHPFLKETLVWNKKENKLGNLLSLVLRVRRNKYDCVINCHRFASSGFITALSGAKHTAGFKQNPFSFAFNHTVKHVIGDGRHETERYNQLVEDFAAGPAAKPKLYPTVKDKAAISQFQSAPYVCMAPASVWFTKQLPEQKWVELCGKISSGKQIYLLGAENDRDLCESIKTKSGGRNITVLAGGLNLLQSCALMQGATMNYVNDSAPLHLASSVNAPVTAYFISTVPAFGFGPLSDNATIKEVAGLQCRPCGLHGFRACPEGHFNCGKQIVI
jgi:heptosyltransferase-2